MAIGTGTTRLCGRAHALILRKRVQHQGTNYKSLKTRLSTIAKINSNQLIMIKLIEWWLRSLLILHNLWYNHNDTLQDIVELKVFTRNIALRSKYRLGYLRLQQKVIHNNIHNFLIVENLQKYYNLNKFWSVNQTGFWLNLSYF